MNYMWEDQLTAEGRFVFDTMRFILIGVAVVIACFFWYMYMFINMYYPKEPADIPVPGIMQDVNVNININ